MISTRSSARRTSDTQEHAASLQFMKNIQHPGRAPLIDNAQAFKQLRAEIMAVPEDQLMHISVDILHTHSIARVAAGRIDKIMPELQKLYGLDLQRIRKLRLYAAACVHAHLLATAPEQTDPRLPRLLEEATKLREELVVTAKMLVVFGVVSADTVASLYGGAGYVELAGAIEQLAILFEGIWDRVEDRVPLTPEKLKRAKALACELHELLQQKKLRPQEKSEAQLVRQRAFTLLVKVYEECQSAVEYLRRREGDAAYYAPSLFVRKKRRGSLELTPEEADDTEEPSTPPVPIRTLVTELAPTG